MRPIPEPKDLEAGVQYIIESNRADGYTPTRFIQITQDGNARNPMGTGLTPVQVGNQQYAGSQRNERSSER